MTTPSVMITTPYNWTGANTFSNQVTLAGSGLTYFKERPHLELSRQLGIEKPTIVYRGMIRGFSMPIYNSDSEELFFDLPCAPARWDGESDPVIYIGGYLDTANTAKKFRMACDWTFFTPNTDAPSGAAVESPTTGDITTGTWAQYNSWSATITLNYDVATPNILAAGDCMEFRLYRLAAVDSGNEIAGEVVVTGMAIKWRMNKLYSSS